MSAVSMEFPEDVSHRLDELADGAGVSSNEYLLELLLEHISDLELVKIADERVAKRRAGLSKTYTLDEVEQHLGLVD
jgi:predicted DNA-binding protein